MSDDTDHRHRNVAAITEYLQAAGVSTLDVRTPDTWDEHAATFDLVVPSFEANTLRESNPMCEAFVAGFMASAEGNNGEMAPSGSTPSEQAEQKYDEWRGGADE